GVGRVGVMRGGGGGWVRDEAVNGVDPSGVGWIRDLIKSLAEQGRTVFVSSHLISEMALTASRLVVIGGGRLLADTTVDELAARGGGSLEEGFFALTGSGPGDSEPGGSPPGECWSAGFQPGDFQPG